MGAGTFNNTTAWTRMQAVMCPPGPRAAGTARRRPPPAGCTPVRVPADMVIEAGAGIDWAPAVRASAIATAPARSGSTQLRAAAARAFSSCVNNMMSSKSHDPVDAPQQPRELPGTTSWAASKHALHLSSTTLLAEPSCSTAQLTPPSRHTAQRSAGLARLPGASLKPSACYSWQIQGRETSRWAGCSAQQKSLGLAFPPRPPHAAPLAGRRDGMIRACTRNHAGPQPLAWGPWHSPGWAGRMGGNACSSPGANMRTAPPQVLLLHKRILNKQPRWVSSRSAILASPQVCSRHALQWQTAGGGCAYRRERPPVPATLRCPPPLCHTGWMALYDEDSGKRYYWDQNSNQTTYQRPDGAGAEVRPHVTGSPCPSQALAGGGRGSSCRLKPAAAPCEATVVPGGAHFGVLLVWASRTGQPAWLQARARAQGPGGRRAAQLLACTGQAYCGLQGAASASTGAHAEGGGQSPSPCAWACAQARPCSPCFSRPAPQCAGLCPSMAGCRPGVLLHSSHACCLVGARACVHPAPRRCGLSSGPLLLPHHFAHPGAGPKWRCPHRVSLVAVMCSPHMTRRGSLPSYHGSTAHTDGVAPVWPGARCGPPHGEGVGGG